jgi:hypothetical protein
MKSGLFPGNLHASVLLIFLLVFMTGQAAGFEDGESGWEPRRFQQPESWRELGSALPAYPQEKNLLDTGVSTAGRPYRIFLDEPALSVTDDRIVRYTVVIISDDGIWNVTHEGLHCGEQAYRRYAYGVNGEWQELGDSPWLPLDDSGINAYRRKFYLNYMCDPASPYLQQPEQIIRKFRSRRMIIGD